MSDKKEMRVQHLTCKRYGQSVEYVTAIINKFDPEMHNKIVIEHVPVTQLQSLQERLDIAVEALKKVNDHAESCALFIYDKRGCTCFYKDTNKALKKIENLSKNDKEGR